jgi:(S)-3,5-dihydroxyphenylglycine transaminase
MDVVLKGCFADPLVEVMNFLNEVVLRYPDAISFAPGRPAEQHFDVAGSFGLAPRFAEHRARATGRTLDSVYKEMGQYGRTNGIVHDLIARQLEIDEGIRVAPEAIVVTAGCQEGMAILLAGLFEIGKDALLVSDPTYIGITGLARILGIDVVPVASGEDGLAPEAAARAIEETRRRGLRPRAIYDVPDFNNPLGTRMPVAARQELLELAHREGVLLFEDNPYGMFCYDGEPLPTLKALDQHGVVVYMGSFSKTLFPGLRVGYLVADQPVTGPAAPATLAQELSKVKSLTTVNTSPLLQAIAGGLLLENGGSLRGVVAERLPFYSGNRDAMLSALERAFAGGLAGEVTWNRPGGGFFLTVNLPFDFTDEDLEVSARDYGVVCCPMRFFSLTSGRERQVRLSFSYVTPEQIEQGVGRFARFVHDRVAVPAAVSSGVAAGA